MRTRITTWSSAAFAAAAAVCAVARPAYPAALPAARKEVVLYSFCQTSGCPDGQFPYGPMVQDARGNFYGTTVAGGNKNNAGTIYEFERVKKAWVFHSLYSFCTRTNCTDGSSPEGGLIVDTSGNLYGTAVLGGNANQGVVFELRKHGKFKILYSFCAKKNCTDGALPDSGLAYQGQRNGQLYDGKSTLYGTAEEKGPHSRGVAYAIAPDGSESTLYGFGADADDGADPMDPLIMDGAGNLYGTTSSGGSENGGTIFGINPSGVETMSFSFCSQGANCGFYPGQGGLLMTPDGALVGTTPNGGTYVSGVVFSFSTGTYQTLASFCNGSLCPSGGDARGALIEDSSGNLYGVAPLGGNTEGGGTVFEFTGSRLKALYSFCALANCADGKAPYAKLIMNSRGDLFGTTTAGGAYNGGAIFELL